MTLGQKIQEFRKKNNLTLIDAAKISGLNEEYIQGIETGRRKPKKIETIKKISNLLKVDIRDIMDMIEP